MLHTLEQLVADYGYVAILIGTFFEGETILLVGAFAAHQGYLRIDMVILIAFVGSCAGDQFWYMLGRRYGPGRLVKRPWLADRVERITRWLDRYPTLFILGFRFVYGIRNIAPVAIALSKIPPWRFYVLNVFAAAIWAVTGGVAGYIFGAAVEAFVGHLKVVAAAACRRGAGTDRLLRRTCPVPLVPQGPTRAGTRARPADAGPQRRLSRISSAMPRR
ncbi:MAG TPA: DedA family protein [Alphaproteobacteria bacterium]|nr:DedA family protein [Alphaproteobacteria bacterium]